MAVGARGRTGGFDDSSPLPYTDEPRPRPAAAPKAWARPRNPNQGESGMTQDADKPVGWSGSAYFTLDDLAAMQPGLARIMPEVGQRYWKLYYAAEAANWPMAKFQLGEIEELMEFGMITRPKYADDLETFVRQDMRAMKNAIESKDWESFDAAYQQGIKNANDYHKSNNKGMIVWKLPGEPPPDLDLAPVEE